MASRKTVATWNPSCGEDGPHGIRLDEKAGYLFVACSAQAKVLDVGRSGSVLSSIATGDGVDDIDYVPTTHLLYVGAAKAGNLTIARADKAGRLTLVAQVPTHEGARNGVVAKDGTVWFTDSSGSPTQPMQGVNVVARWIDPATNLPSRQYVASSVSGFLFTDKL